MTTLTLTPTQRLVLDLEDALKPAVPHLSAQELWRLAGAIFRLKREVGLPALQVAAVQRRPVYERVDRPSTADCYADASDEPIAPWMETKK